MNFLKKILSKIESKQPQQKVVQESTDLEQTFVQHFVQKGGKFLYCTNISEVVENLQNILLENQWDTLNCISKELTQLYATLTVKIKPEISKDYPILTKCECLIAANGSILFSSNQLKNNKIHELNTNFIVFAKTSQFVKNRGESLTAIKASYKKDLPTNISAIDKFSPKKIDDNFMNYGNNNAKNLYLLLLEDL